eukprot:GFUD01106353.1.p1 GENE.GFUD01106353.1~~GFUD01106353.1.p1  ORF type:complete len:116 (+),score=27.08 GFUD01106353.1:88-435(+)
MTNMKAILFPLLAAVLIGTTMSKNLDDRAPAVVTFDDCDCQCDGTTYLDEHDTVQGNCQSADTSGRKWCYISSDINTLEACKDGFEYDSRYNMSKSYAACSSPDPSSDECTFYYD